MKLHVKMLERLIEIPTCSSDEPGRSELRHLLDDLGLEVKGVEVTDARGVTFTIETLANRGDHLYALGVAREISARTLAQIKPPATAPQLPERKTAIPIRRVTEKCSRYALLEMNIPSEMILRSDVALFVDEPGKRPPIVDLLNYLQAEVGQPMHAFDFEKVDGEIVIDVGTQEEVIDALDGKTYRVPAGAILIRDRKKTIAVAGVIGCANSMVTESTRKVLIEAATFDPVSVRVTARAMGLSTDASYAFERGCDPESIPYALKRLIVLASGSAGAVGSSDSAHPLGYSWSESHQAEKRRVRVSLGAIRRHLNLPRLDEVEVAARLKNLGYGLETQAEGKDKIFALSVPSWRLWDVKNPEDVIEDAARSVSLSRVKPELPPLDYDQAPLSKFEQVLRRVRPALVGQGFAEVITKVFYSAADVSVLGQLDPSCISRHMAIKNSLEQGNSHLKLTNMLHMARVISMNRKRGVVAPKAYEFARVFEKPATPPQKVEASGSQPEYEYERDVLCLAAGGRWSDSEFRKGEDLAHLVQLFTGAVGGVVRSLGGRVSVGKSDEKLLHPGVQGSIKLGRSIVGYVGVVHPTLAEHVESREPILYCELECGALMRALQEPVAPTVSDLPSIKRDFTLKLEAKDQCGRVVRLMQEGEVESLTEVLVIDDFRRENEPFRRVTFRLRFQRVDRTLQHEEVDRTTEMLITRLKEKHSLELAP